jgi:hypothetical protein
MGYHFKAPRYDSVYDSIPDFQGILGGSPHRDWTCIRSDERQILFTYQNGITSNQNFALVDFLEVPGNPDGFSFDFAGTIQIQQAGLVNRIHSYAKRYFICSTNKLAIVDGAGNQLTHNGLPSNIRPQDVLNIGDSLLLIARNELFYSVDQGNNWTLLTDNLPIKSEPNFYLINDELVISSIDEIYHVKVDQGVISLLRIENDAVMHREISGILSFNGYVYVATFAGTYRKPIEDFFTYKDG